MLRALVVTLMVVVLHEGLDLGLKVAGQEVIFQQDPVLQGLVQAFEGLCQVLSEQMHRLFPIWISQLR